MDARQSVITALAKRGEAAELVAESEAAHALAVTEAEAADKRLSDVAEAEREAATALADRIRTAAKAGGKLKPTGPGDEAIARGTAEAEARAAHAALLLLERAGAAARSALDEAQNGVQLATQAAAGEVASRIIDAMDAALRVLEDGHFHLVALDQASWTATAEGNQRLRFDERARKFVGWTFTPRQRAGGAAAALTDRWRAWRNDLTEDPYAASPWDGDGE